MCIRDRFHIGIGVGRPSGLAQAGVVIVFARLLLRAQKQRVLVEMAQSGETLVHVARLHVDCGRFNAHHAIIITILLVLLILFIYMGNDS